MKISFIYTPSRVSWSYTYRKYPWLRTAEYEIQLARLLAEPNGGMSGYQSALTLMGHECQTVFPEINPLQQTWFRENVAQKSGPLNGQDILQRQIASFQPDVLYCSVSNSFGSHFIRSLKASVPSIKAVVMYVGSFTYDVDLIKDADVVVACSQELVDSLVVGGAKAHYIPHAFDSINVATAKSADIVQIPKVFFSGSLVRRKGMHDEREKVLAHLARNLPSAYYLSMAHSSSSVMRMDWCLLKVSSEISRGISHIPFLGSTFGRSNTFRRLSRIRVADSPIVSRDISKVAKPPVYGLDVYALYRSYLVTLNHSGEYASAENLRLFEATGAGACLLTDFKFNLADYFSLDDEVVTYSSEEECVEKAKYLLDHPDVARGIGISAAQRSAQEHTYVKRSELLQKLLSDALSS